MRAIAAAVLALALAGPAAAAACPTLTDLEDELVCPTCQTTLDQSDSAVADRMREYVRGRVETCASKEQIKAELVAEFGPRVLAEPRKQGFELLAWLLPLGALLAAGVAVGYGIWRWSRVDASAAESKPARAAMSPELERRVDDELARFDG